MPSKNSLQFGKLAHFTAILLIASAVLPAFAKDDKNKGNEKEKKPASQPASPSKPAAPSIPLPANAAAASERMYLLNLTMGALNKQLAAKPGDNALKVQRAKLQNEYVLIQKKFPGVKPSNVAGTTPPADPSGGNPARTTPGAEPPAGRPQVLAVSFRNTTDKPVDVYVANSKGEPVVRGTIEPGEVMKENTFEGTTWFFGVARQPIGRYFATGEANQQFDVKIAATVAKNDPEMLKPGPDASIPAEPSEPARPRIPGRPQTSPADAPAAAAGAATAEDIARLRAIGKDPGPDGWDSWVKSRQKWPPEDHSEELSLITDAFSGQALAADKYSAYGYNVLHMDPRDMQNSPGSSRKAIFRSTNFKDTMVYASFGNVRVPEFYEIDPFDRADSLSTSMLTFNESQSMDAWRASAEVGYAGPVGGAKVSGSASGSAGASSASQSMTMTEYKIFSKFWLTLTKANAQLTRQFRTAVMELDGKGDGEYAKFFKDYGTHYALSTLYGGVAEKKKTLKRAEAGQSSSLAYDVAVEGGYMGVSAKAGFGQTKEQSSKNGFEASDETWSGRGGKGGTYEGYSLQESTDYSPIKVLLEPIYDLVRPQLFNTADATEAAKINGIRATMKSQLQKYTGVADGLVTGPRKFTMGYSIKPLVKADHQGVLAAHIRDPGSAGVVIGDNERWTSDLGQPAGQFDPAVSGINFGDAPQAGKAGLFLTNVKVIVFPNYSLQNGRWVNDWNGFTYSKFSLDGEFGNGHTGRKDFGYSLPLSEALNKPRGAGNVDKNLFIDMTTGRARVVDQQPAGAKPEHVWKLHVWINEEGNTAMEPTNGGVKFPEPPEWVRKK